MNFAPFGFIVYLIIILPTFLTAKFMKGQAITSLLTREKIVKLKA